MSRYYHGTTEENYRSIIKNGFNPDLASSTTWTVSEPNMVYLYPHSEDEDFITNALSNAQISACIQDSQLQGLYVLELEIPDDLVQPDWTTETMSDIAVYVMAGTLSRSMIKSVHFCERGYNKAWRLPLLSIMMHNDLLETSSFTEEEIEVAQGIELTDSLKDRIFESTYDYESYGFQEEEV